MTRVFDSYPTCFAKV